jgi:hypothetical protein
MAWGRKETPRELSVRELREAIKARQAPANAAVPGKLDLSGDASLRTLPAGLSAGWLDLSGCTALERLPGDLHARRLTLSGSWNPARLLPGLRCHQLELQNTTIEEFPEGVCVDHRLDLQGARLLRSLPKGLKVGCLNLRDCVSLQQLPEELDCSFLDISGCTSLESWPQHANVSVGRFAARGCLQLRDLPPWLHSIAQLDLRDCANIRNLPDDLNVSSWIDVAGTRIRSLPAQLKGVQLRWRGVAVDERIAFFPELITADEILAEPNAEKRRVLLERMGYEAFLSHAKAKIIDEDRDAGGPRRLVRVEMKGDEDLLCVSVICPSTARQYVIRVPPTMLTCRQAVAWVAGFDNPDDYRPLIET